MAGQRMICIDCGCGHLLQAERRRGIECNDCGCGHGPLLMEESKRARRDLAEQDRLGPEEYARRAGAFRQ